MTSELKPAKKVHFQLPPQNGERSFTGNQSPSVVCYVGPEKVRTCAVQPRSVADTCGNRWKIKPLTKEDLKGWLIVNPLSIIRAKEAGEWVEVSFKGSKEGDVR